MTKDNGSLEPTPLVQWLYPDVLIDQVCELTGQDQRDNPRLDQLVRKAIRKHRNSDNLRAILEYEQDQVAQKITEHLTPGRLRELTLKLRAANTGTETGQTGDCRTQPQQPNAETIIWNILERGQEAGSQGPGGPWAGIREISLTAPDLFMAVQKELRNYDGPDRLHWEIDAELDRITRKVIDQLDPSHDCQPPPEPWKTPEMWHPSVLWSRSWEGSG